MLVMMILWPWSRSWGTRRSWRSTHGGSSGSGPRGATRQSCGRRRCALGISASPWSSPHTLPVWLGRLSCTGRTGGRKVASPKEPRESCTVACTWSAGKQQYQITEWSTVVDLWKKKIRCTIMLNKRGKKITPWVPDLGLVWIWQANSYPKNTMR